MSNEITVSKKHLFIGIGVVLLLGIYLLLGNISASNTAITGAAAGNTAPNTGGVQKVTIRATSSGYDLPSVTVEKGVPVELTFQADQNVGCGSTFLMSDFGIQLNGGQTATFTPDKAGDFPYSCPMRMFRGTLHVV